MTEEIEVPLEKLQEDVHHAAAHAAPSAQQFINRSALLSAFLAALAAVSALFAGHDANEAMMEQIHASDQWAYYQAKGIKSAIAELQLSQAGDEATKAAAREKIEGYKREQGEIKEKAEENEKAAAKLLQRHEGLASAVTLFQVSIALTAIAVLSRKRSFLVTAAVVGGLGVTWLTRAFL